jgi:hypothetical protein
VYTNSSHKASIEIVHTNGGGQIQNTKHEHIDENRIAQSNRKAEESVAVVRDVGNARQSKHRHLSKQMSKRMGEDIENLVRDLSTKSISDESKDETQDEIDSRKRDSFIDLDGDSSYQINVSNLVHTDSGSGRYSKAMFDSEKKEDVTDRRTDHAELSVSTSLHRVSEDDWREEFKAVWKMECVFI